MGLPADHYEIERIASTYNLLVLEDGAQEDGGAIFTDEEDFQVTNELCDCVLSLPMHPYLKETDVELVAKVVSDYIKKSNL